VSQRRNAALRAFFSRSLSSLCHLWLLFYFLGKLTTCCKNLYTVCNASILSVVSFLTSFLKRGKPWLGFGPRTFALPRQRSTRLSYQGTNTPIRNEVMELHLKHIESSLTARQVSKSLLAN
jgi:hypothetical protein